MQSTTKLRAAHKQTNRNPAMKKLLFVLTLAILIILGIKKMIALDEAKADTLNSFYQEKQEIYTTLASKAVETLREEVQKRLSSRVEPTLLLENELTPWVLKDRLDKMSYQGGDRKTIFDGANQALSKVILFDHLVRSQPNTSPSELILDFNSLNHRKTPENDKIITAATAEYQGLIRDQQESLVKIGEIVTR